MTTPAVYAWLRGRGFVRIYAPAFDIDTTVSSARAVAIAADLSHRVPPPFLNGLRRAIELAERQGQHR